MEQQTVDQATITLLPNEAYALNVANKERTGIGAGIRTFGARTLAATVLIPSVLFGRSHIVKEAELNTQDYREQGKAFSAGKNEIQRHSDSAIRSALWKVVAYSLTTVAGEAFTIASLEIMTPSVHETLKISMIVLAGLQVVSVAGSVVYKEVQNLRK